MPAKTLSLLDENQAYAAAIESNHSRFERFNQAVGELESPVGVLDWAALSANAYFLRRRADSMPIRVASKSVRTIAVLKAILELDGFAGVLGFSAPEAIHLVESGVTDDVLIAYPTTNVRAIKTIIEDDQLRNSITFMVDHPDQIQLIREFVVAQRLSTPVRLCLDLDCSLKVGPVHIGARRSPIHDPAQAAAAAGFIAQRPGIRLVGAMGYEAQVAGVTDSGPLIAAVKAVSIADLNQRRQAMVHAIENTLRQHKEPPLEFVNGGGTGSLESTRQDSAVTELAAGSGFFGPHLFDGYRQFSPVPAAFFGLDVVRHPAPSFITLHGGGWVASGEPGQDRLPQPVWPEGLSYLSTEAAGEVQTPLKVSGDVPPIGSRVWMRHTKAGELTEHLNHFQVVHQDTRIATIPTYRGEGYAFI